MVYWKWVIWPFLGKTSLGVSGVVQSEHKVDVVEGFGGNDLRTLFEVKSKKNCLGNASITIL